MITAIVQQAHKLRFLANDHSTTILTGLGVSGTVATAYLAGKASFKAADILAKENAIINTAVEENQDPVTLTKKDKAKLVYKFYIPAAGAGLITIVSIISSNRISSKRIAALAVASGISERALQEYKDKVVEKLGLKEDQKLKDEISQDKVTKNPPSGEVVVVGDGNVLCYDEYTGRYFQSTVEQIRQAVNQVNHGMMNHMYASASEFYEKIGLEATTLTDNVGWNTDRLLEVAFSSTLTPDKRPCLSMGFTRPPSTDYEQRSFG